LLAGSSLTTTKGASKVNGREIDMVQYDGEACTILGEVSTRNRNKKRAPDLARALRFSRRRHSWMTG